MDIIVAPDLIIERTIVMFAAILVFGAISIGGLSLWRRFGMNAPGTSFDLTQEIDRMRALADEILARARALPNANLKSINTGETSQEVTREDIAQSTRR